MHIELIHKTCELLIIWGVSISILVFFFLIIDKLFKLYEVVNKIALTKYKKEKKNIKALFFIIVSIYIILVTLINLFDYQLQNILLLFSTYILIMIYFNQNIIKDYLNGYRILNEDKFRVGDIIKINNNIGEVIKIGLKNTIILNNEETLISIPNSKIEVIEIISITKEVAKYDFLVNYDSNIEKVEILLKLLTKEIEKNIKGIENKVSYITISEMNSCGILYRVKAPVKKENKNIVQSEIRKLIHNCFKKENIDLIEVNND